MSELVRMTEEAESIVRRYGKNATEGILEMERLIRNPASGIQPSIQGNLEEEIRAVMSRMDTFMSHGQGGIRVYPMPVDKVDGKCVPRVVEYEKGEQTIMVEGAGELVVPPRDLEFRRASVREEK
jgi:hypothetical protein